MPATATKTKTAKSRTSVARIPKALRAQAEAILAEEVAFMDSIEFEKAGVEKTLFGEVLPELPFVDWYQPTRDDNGEALVSTPKLMNTAEERLMFLRFNYAKKRLIETKAAANDGLTKQIAQDLALWHGRYEHLREYLTRTNLALVLAMAKRSRLGDIDFSEVVSEGNMALLRAVEKFNIDKGFKFSTYACRAILKAFSRIAVKHSRHRTRFPVEFEPDFEKSDWPNSRRESVEVDLTDELKQIVNRNLADLSDVEQTVIRRRFNWEQADDSSLTLEQVGQIIGVAKERVRQIQNKALIKIRRIMEDGVLKSRETPKSALEA